MKLKLLYQCLIFLVYLIFIQCQNQKQTNEIKKNEFLKIGDNVLHNGRIVSKPVQHPLPVDQRRTPELQQDDTNRSKPKYIANGDILTPMEETQFSDSKRSKRKVIAETNYFGGSNRWPRGVVPYEFISDIDYRVQQNVLNAIQHWHQHTCIRFEPYDPQRHWDIEAKITIEDAGSGCATFVGYRPSEDGQPLSYSVYLPSVCPLGSAIHELGHVIGFYHEMARTDRDLEINLYFNLMPSAEAGQYDIMPNPMPGYYGQPYDLGSIMHYRPTDVMSARDNRRSFLMGQRIALSFLDSKLANLAYHCSDHCSSKLVCDNEGYLSQYCQCVCPDGFTGDRCDLLQGYALNSRVFPSGTQSPVLVDVEKPQTKSPSTTTITPTIENSTKVSVHWLEWSKWSNCSESCGSGIHVRTRLCSDTTIDGSSEPCASLGGASFEIESCQNAKCNQTDVIMSCTFDIPNEKCPLKDQNDWQIQNGAPGGQLRPISDHTRGDGKYLVIIGNTTRPNHSQKFQLGPMIHSKTSNENYQCLQFWYSAHGQGTGKITISYNKTNNNTFAFHENEQNTSWKQIQRTISYHNDYKLIFTYESNASDYNYIAIDDISIINGACLSKNIDKQLRRKRRQASTSCSRVIDLTATNAVASITSPNYPNLYPSNIQCYYYIRAPQSSHVLLQFTDFNVPTNNFNNCDDSVEIRYYNLGQTGPKYCGTGANSNNLRFTSTKNYIMIVFQSDQNFGGRGFRAQATLAQ